MGDLINSPKHYTSHPSGVEAIEICEHLDFCLGNAVKYLFRAKHKGHTLQDLQKAVWYLRRSLASKSRLKDMRGHERLADVLRYEDEDSVLGYVLNSIAMTSIAITEIPNSHVELAIARVEREIETVREKR